MKKIEEITAEELLKEEEEEEEEITLIQCNGEPVLTINKHKDGVFIYGRWAPDIDEPINEIEVSSLASEALNWAHIEGDNMEENEKFILHPSVGVIFFISDGYWEPHYNTRENEFEEGKLFTCK